MQKEIRARLDSLPKTEASFVEPMDCLSVSKLPEGLEWLWEILCGEPHKISSVAPDVMWRWGPASPWDAREQPRTPHNF
jgi:hypothetical protein